ncbi:MAG: hypothetical protein ACK4SY_06820 [Pyrobaculum sp.]
MERIFHILDWVYGRRSDPPYGFEGERTDADVEYYIKGMLETAAIFLGKDKAVEYIEDMCKIIGTRYECYKEITRLYSRNEMELAAFYLTGWLKAAGVPYEQAKAIIEKNFGKR